MAFVIRICYVCVLYLFSLCVFVQATVTKRTVIPNGIEILVSLQAKKKIIIYSNGKFILIVTQISIK